MKKYFVVRTETQYFGIAETIYDACRKAMKAGADIEDRALVNVVTSEEAPVVDEYGNLCYKGDLKRLYSKPFSIKALLKDEAS